MEATASVTEATASGLEATASITEATASITEAVASGGPEGPFLAKTGVFGVPGPVLTPLGAASASDWLFLDSPKPANPASPGVADLPHFVRNPKP
ncbi:MAG: hypothetical protein NT105_23555 [Verrucomicrobia bacterium]|nr:hypothetical protein [Verrucomicrobiota bacterium]